MFNGTFFALYVNSENQGIIKHFISLIDIDTMPGETLEATVSLRNLPLKVYMTINIQKNRFLHVISF
jgi:hypothetical protein